MWLMLKKVMIISVALMLFLFVSGCKMDNEEKPYVSYRKEKTVETPFNKKEEKEVQEKKDAEEKEKQEAELKEEANKEEEEKKEPKTYRVRADVLNIRDAKLEDAQVLGQVYMNEKLKVLKLEGAWALVKYGEIEGYAKAEWLDEVQTKKLSVMNADILTSQYENAYALGALKRFDEVEVLETFTFDGVEWHQISFEGIIGYVKAEFFK